MTSFKDTRPAIWPTRAPGTYTLMLDDPDNDVPYRMFYYWHPESDSLFSSAEPQESPELEELTEREYVLLELFILDEEAFDLIAYSTKEGTAHADQNP